MTAAELESRHRTLVARRQGICNRYGLPMSNGTDLRYRALRAIADYEHMTIGQLAVELRLSASALTSVSDGLERLGWIIRERGTPPRDRRQVFLSIHPTRRDAWAALHDEVTAAEAE